MSCRACLSTRYWYDVKSSRIEIEASRAREKFTLRSEGDLSRRINIRSLISCEVVLAT